MVNFFHRFVPAAAHHMQPLFAMLAGKSRQSHLVWTDEMSSTLTATKQALAEATMLAHPRPDVPTALTVDVSDRAIGGILEQHIDSLWQPLAFFSRQLRPPETKYSAFDCELLAAHLAVRHFHFFLEGRIFTIYTDHKPLTLTMHKVSELWSARQQRHLSAISEFTTDIQHVAGKDNPVADTLSQATINLIVSTGFDYSAMSAAQQEDPDLASCRTTTSSLQLAQLPFGEDGLMLACDISHRNTTPHCAA